MQWNLTTIIILVVVLFVGYGIGLLEYYLKYSGKLKQAEQKIAALQAAKEPTTVIPASEPSALRVWVDPAQALNLELDGERVESSKSITPEQRRRLIMLLAQIRPWLEGGPIAPASQMADRPVKPLAAAQSISVAAPVAPPAPEPPSTVGAKSIVLQIDDVLQKLLVGTPLAGRRIMLRESPTGGVLVKVGPDHYEGIDAVPDAEIQAIIRQAVAEWEKGSR